VTALLLTAVDRTGRETGIAHTADVLVAVELTGQHLKGRLDDTTSQTEHQVQGGLLLDVVVAQSTPILELLTSEDQSLLIRRDSFLILDLGLDGVDGITGLDIEGDGLSGEGLDEDLHLVFSSLVRN